MERTDREQRDFRRISVHFKVYYRREDDSPKSIQEALTANISEGGVLITGKRAHFVSTILYLAIIAPQREKPIKTKGKVIRVEEVEEGKLYEMGIQFLGMDHEDAEYIKRYVEGVDLDRILRQAVERNASDIHLVSDQPPIMRVHGELIPITQKSLTKEQIADLLFGILRKTQIQHFQDTLELDTTYTNDTGRFRMNVHQERGQLGAAFRYISTEIRGVSELNLPKNIENLARKPNGLILVAGPTGSGKSTTLAAMIEVINKEKKRMIISLEDPIEYLYKSKESIIKQREIGFDSHSFVNALKHTLRQDVDVILVGEMRDLDSISIALRAAETGHLVMTTLHTTDAASSINRIIDVFPSDQQRQVRTQLAGVLRGVICQILLPREDQEGRIPATEILINTAAVANIIRQGNLENLYNVMMTSSQQGMHLMDSSLERLCKKRIVSRENALPYVKDPSLFDHGAYRAKPG